MESNRARQFAEGLVPVEEMSPRERVLVGLVRKSCHSPALLEPADLEPLIDVLGLSGALEIVAIIGSFHYITRLTDLVGLRAWLQTTRERVRWIRIVGHSLHTALARWGMDFTRQEVEIDAEAELAEIERLRGRASPVGYRLMLEAPSLAAYTRAMVNGLETLDRDLLGQIERVVGESLPAGREELGSVSPPEDPLDELVFTGTRRAYLVTASLVDRVRHARGWSDTELTDAFYAISTLCTLEVFDRLLATG